MTDCVFGFIRALAGVPDLLVDRVRTQEGIVTARVSHRGTSAVLVCNRFDPPFRLDRSGRKLYGTYVIIDQGYGHWVKGDDAKQCVAYTLGWLNGRELRVAKGLTSLHLDTAGWAYDGIDPVRMPDLVREISERSSLRPISEAALASPDQSVLLCLLISDGLVHASVGRFSLILSAASVRVAAATLLGFADSVTGGSDE